MNTDSNSPSSDFEQRVQAAVEQRMADWQAQFATMMQTNMQQSLGGLDQLRDQLEIERNALIAEQEITREERESIRRQANQLLQEALDENYFAWKQKIEREFLKGRIRGKLESGESNETICNWLDVDADWVAEIQTELATERKERELRRGTNPISLPHHPRVTYSNAGRGGTIYFQNDVTTFNLWWEFGGRDALVLIGIPNSDQWEAVTALPLAERDQTIRYIAEQVLIDQTTQGGTYRYTEEFLTIYV
jgi:hypothetical protein